VKIAQELEYLPGEKSDEMLKLLDGVIRTLFGLVRKVA